MKIFAGSRRFHLVWGLVLVCIGWFHHATSSATYRVDHINVWSARQAMPGYAFHFPYDHGSHNEFRIEWWYYTGHLTAKDGRQFGYELTFFRRGVEDDSVKTNPSRWAVRHLYLAHVALSDHGNQAFRYAEKISRAGIGKAGADTGRLHVWLDRWMADSAEQKSLHHHLKASTDEFSLELDLEPKKPPIVHGQGGVSRKGQEAGQTSHYYSLTRLATTGTLVVNGTQIPVTGTSWMDHEFGSGEWGCDQVGWDWFSIQLDDQSEIMLYVLRRRDGTADPTSSGTLILPDGQSQHLSLADMRIEPLSYWQSPSSKARYPARWRISLPTIGLTLDALPKLANQELVTTRSTQVTYWEGAVSVSGRAQDTTVLGEGYVELTGYAEPFRQR